MMQSSSIYGAYPPPIPNTGSKGAVTRRYADYEDGFTFNSLDGRYTDTPFGGFYSERNTGDTFERSFQKGTEKWTTMYKRNGSGIIDQYVRPGSGNITYRVTPLGRHRVLEKSNYDEGAILGRLPKDIQCDEVRKSFKAGEGGRMELLDGQCFDIFQGQFAEKNLDNGYVQRRYTDETSGNTFKTIYDREGKISQQFATDKEGNVYAITKNGWEYQPPKLN
ncbi:MAG: hypothetical protein ACKO37_07555 [Vampirovibrionales bacterium]